MAVEVVDMTLDDDDDLQKAIEMSLLESSYRSTNEFTPPTPSHYGATTTTPLKRNFAIDLDEDDFQRQLDQALAASIESVVAERNNKKHGLQSPSKMGRSPSSTKPAWFRNPHVLESSHIDSTPTAFRLSFPELSASAALMSMGSVQQQPHSTIASHLQIVDTATPHPIKANQEYTSETNKRPCLSISHDIGGKYLPACDGIFQKPQQQQEHEMPHQEHQQQTLLQHQQQELYYFENNSSLYTQQQPQQQDQAFFTNSSPDNSRNNSAAGGFTDGAVCGRGIENGFDRRPSPGIDQQFCTANPAYETELDTRPQPPLSSGPCTNVAAIGQDSSFSSYSIGGNDDGAGLGPGSTRHQDGELEDSRIRIRRYYRNQKVLWRNNGEVHLAQVLSFDAFSSPLIYFLELQFCLGERSVQSTHHDLLPYLETGERVWWRHDIPWVPYDGLQEPSCGQGVMKGTATLSSETEATASTDEATTTRSEATASTIRAQGTASPVVGLETASHMTRPKISSPVIGPETASLALPQLTQTIWEDVVFIEWCNISDSSEPTLWIGVQSSLQNRLLLLHHHSQRQHLNTQDPSSIGDLSQQASAHSGNDIRLLMQVPLSTIELRREVGECSRSFVPAEGYVTSMPTVGCLPHPSPVEMLSEKEATPRYMTQSMTATQSPFDVRVPLPSPEGTSPTMTQSMTQSPFEVVIMPSEPVRR